MLKDRYDVVVVGAGPSGAATALELARNGIDVLLVERGPYPGSKNMFGGNIYAEVTAQLVPGFWERAPIERVVVTDELWMMEPSSVCKIGFTGQDFSKPPYNKFNVLRSKFDRWFAQEAVDAGAELTVNTLIKDLRFAKGFIGSGKVTGVVTERGEEIEADVTVLAEGVNAYLAKKAGLRQEFPAFVMTLYAQEIMELPEATINERFNVNSGEGTVIGTVGYPLGGTIGKGGIWTNKDTVSVTIGGLLSQMVDNSYNPYLLLQRFKSHPVIKRLLAGAKTVEYKASMIPKGGYQRIPTLYDDGVIIVGDAAVMVSGRHGTDLAMLSGKFAAETILLAKAKGDFSKKSLATYGTKINNTFFMKDIKSNKGTLTYFRQHPDADYLVSKAVNEVAYKFFTEGMMTGREKTDQLIKELTTLQVPTKTAADIIAGLGKWRVF